jgi:para-aminobenzoate synthetase component 1
MPSPSPAASEIASTAQALVRAIPSEITPLVALGAVGHLPHTLHLESGGPLVESSDWTILAFDPVWRLELRDGRLRRIQRAAPDGRDRETTLPGNPLSALAAAWPDRAAFESAPPIPFASGLAGYLGYDLKDWIERFPSRARREVDLPDLSLGFYDIVWAWRRRTGEAWVVSTGLSETDPDARAGRARERLDSQWATIARAPASARPEGSASKVIGDVRGRTRRVESDFTRDAYLRNVERALELIAAGDIYQVNLAQRFQVDPAPEFGALYRSLREIAPAPFLASLTLPGGGVASSSPERFFRIEGDLIETWPIKGTRPRGATPEADAELAGALRRSAKDRAENVMIVDLERNDLGRVCEIGSVWVPALCEVSSHSNVHHLVSRVEGRLRPDAGPVDVIRAMFPGGSITGAPKIRAVEIIDALEPVRRGVYTGAIGYWDVSGNCDWNVAIRTIVSAGGVASFHVGGGIVADSTPEGEYEETLVKASGMMRALGVRWGD